MHRPPSELNPITNQGENQDRTQLTSGGIPAPGEFNVGDVVGGAYEVLALIGSGGMGHVYRVRHVMMQQEYALKALSAEQVNEQAWRRFQNEAQAIARMSHPNIVGIYNLGLHDGRLPYYVMDLVNGRTLMEVLHESGPLPLNETLAIFCEVAAGMGYAHRKGIVHRDIKPPNILLLNASATGTGRVKIVDFGIAKLSGIKDKANQGLTSVGEICGSPFYMSPEQCDGGRVDTRSDIYSFGCTLFEAITGEPPFKGRNAVETMLMHQTAKPPSLFRATGKKYPAALEQALATMLAKAPMDRYQNMERIIQDFNNIIDGKDAAISPYVSTSAQMPKAKPLTKAQRDEADERTEAQGSLWKKVAAGVIAAAVSAGLIVGVMSLYKMLAPTKAESHSSTHFTKLDAKPTESAPVKIAAVSTQGSYSHEQIVDGKRMLYFDFPDGANLGTLRTISKNQNIPARGHIEYPAGVKLELIPDESVAQNTDLYAHFRKGDIYRVMYGSLSGSNSMVKAISQIPGLKELQLRACDSIDDGCLHDLVKLTDLTELRLEMTSISGSGMAKLPYLKQLRSVYLCGASDGDNLCQALAQSERLDELVLDNSPLTIKGIKALSSLKNLKSLMINSTPLGDAELKELAKIPGLRIMYAQNCGITARQTPIIRTFPALKTLVVETSMMRRKDLLDIQRGLPKVSVQ
ncbi:MAG: protein kinase [Cyanobacteria bacterium SZAS LIN-3]|nr:protein kinase [Cyanobacteria bacterium SZAS LIN-3]